MKHLVPGICFCLLLYFLMVEAYESNKAAIVLTAANFYCDQRHKEADK